jgi:hypothetical protein
MAVLSILCLSNEEALSKIFSLWAPFYDKVQEHDIRDSDSPFATTTGLMPPLALPGVNLAPSSAHSPDIKHTYIGGNDHGAPQRHDVIAPIDGDTNWYCSECGDGPYGAWQVSCQRCSHPKCTSCRVEAV